eukprot:UN15177
MVILISTLMTSFGLDSLVRKLHISNYSKYR